MRELIQELGRTAFHIVKGMPSPSFVTLSTLRRFEGLLLDIQEDRQASALLRSLVPEQDPTPHRGNLTEGLYIGLYYEKVCFAQKNFS